MYTAPIADAIKRHGMGFHFYADDTQIHMSFNPAVALQSKSVILRGAEKVLTGLRDSYHSQAIRKSMPSKFSSDQDVF